VDTEKQNSWVRRNKIRRYRETKHVGTAKQNTWVHRNERRGYRKKTRGYKTTYVQYRQKRSSLSKELRI
jgi:hypothetical protein